MERDSHNELKHTAIEFASSAAAGISGAMVYGAVMLESGGLGRAVSVGLAGSTGGAVKFGVKSALEHVLLDEKDRTAGKGDLAWGAVDGFAGVAGSIAEREVSSQLLKNIGFKYLGKTVGESGAEMAGRKVIAGVIGEQIKHNTLRGLAGGAAGSFAWAVPHSINDNWQTLKDQPMTGILNTQAQILQSTVLGTVIGGGFGAGATALARSARLFGLGTAKIQGDANVTRLDIAHLNDLHSELVGSRGLPRIATKLDDLRVNSAERGVTRMFLNAGDTESGNVAFAYSKGGLVENEALAKMGQDAIVPGNHPYDKAGGGADVARYIGVMKEVKSRHDVPLLAANLDLSAFPEYEGMVQPYLIKKFAGPRGDESVGIIGLITEEGAVGGIGYKDPVAAANKYIQELNAKGVNKVVVLSHLGLSEDIALAKQVKGISAIVGGHSHDFEPVPRWVKGVPIVQAGSNGRWLGDLNLAFKPNGAADPFRTTGRLHEITGKVSPKPDIEAFVDANLGDVNGLKKIGYNTSAVSSYSMANIRNRETPLGNLVSDAVRFRLVPRLGSEAPDIVLTHSGGIRSGIKPGEPLTRYDLANVYMHAGDREKELHDLVLVLNMKGRQVKDVLEFGVHDLKTPNTGKSSPIQRLGSYFKDNTASNYSHEPGNFLQVSGVRYKFDLTKTPKTFAGGPPARVSDVMFEPTPGKLEPLDDNKIYKVVTRYHPFEKWHKFGVFGDKTLADTEKLLGVKPVLASQVDMLSEHISGQIIDPKVMGRVEGRITDLTPKAWRPTLRPGLSLVSYSALESERKRVP